MENFENMERCKIKTENCLQHPDFGIFPSSLFSVSTNTRTRVCVRVCVHVHTQRPTRI